MVVILFAPEIMKVMAPLEYQEGIYVIPPVAASMYFILLFNVYAPVEHFSLKTKFIAVASMIATLAKIVLNIIFIEGFGYLAAGYTTLVCYIVYALAHYIYMKRVCRKDLGGVKLFDDRFVWLFGGVLTIFSIITARIYEFVVLRYLLIAVIMFMLVLKRKTFVNMFKGMK